MGTANNQGNAIATTDAAQVPAQAQRTNPLDLALTDWQRIADARLRNTAIVGNPYDEEYDLVLLRVGNDDRALGMERLMAMGAQEIEPHVQWAEQRRTERLRQQTQRLVQQQEALPGDTGRLNMQLDSSLNRYQKAMDESQKELPDHQVRGTDEGASSPLYERMLARVETLLSKLHACVAEKAITPKALADGEVRMQLAKSVVKSVGHHQTAVRELAGTQRALADNQKLLAAEANAREGAHRQLFGQWMPWMEGLTKTLMERCGTLETQLTKTQSSLELLEVLVSSISDGAANAGAMEGVEHHDLDQILQSIDSPIAAAAPAAPAPAVMVPAAQAPAAAVPAAPAPVAMAPAAPAQNQPVVLPLYQKPTDTLPDGLSYGSIDDAWFVFKGSNGVPFRRWQQQTAEGVDPFAAANPANKVRLPNPQPYTGESGDVDPEMAIMNIETWLTASQVPRDQWATMGQSFLRGAAQRAYSHIALTMYAKGQTPSWEQVKTIIRSFKRQDASVVARGKLAKLQQTHSVAAYNRSFTELLVQVGAEPPAPTDLMRFYLQGLKAAQYLNPQGQAWTSLEAAQEFHLQRELAQLSVQAPTTTNRAPFKPFAKPRLNAVRTQRPGGIPPAGPAMKRGGEQGGRGGRGGFGGRGGAGGRGGGYGAASEGAGPSATRDLSAFGSGDALYANLDAACPVHPNAPRPHTKGMCGLWHKAIAAAKAAK
jgi:hypothetical protein